MNRIPMHPSAAKITQVVLPYDQAGENVLNHPGAEIIAATSPMRSEHVLAATPSFQLGKGFLGDVLKSSIKRRTILRRSNSESTKRSRSWRSPYHSPGISW